MYKNLNITLMLFWSPSWLDRGALMLKPQLVRPWCTYVEAPESGTSVVQKFSSWGTVVLQGFFAESAFFPVVYKVTEPRSNEEAILIRIRGY